MCFLLGLLIKNARLKMSLSGTALQTAQRRTGEFFVLCALFAVK
jgi:hypothetical protein